MNGAKFRRSGDKDVGQEAKLGPKFPGRDKVIGLLDAEMEELLGGIARDSAGSHSSALLAPNTVVLSSSTAPWNASAFASAGAAAPWRRRRKSHFHLP